MHIKTRIGDFYISTNWIADWVGDNGTYETMVFDQRDKEEAWTDLSCDRSTTLEGAVTHHLIAIRRITAT